MKLNQKRLLEVQSRYITWNNFVTSDQEAPLTLAVWNRILEAVVDVLALHVLL